MESWSAPGDVLRWWRRDVLGMSQQAAANRLSVQPTALSNWENGNRAISIDLDQVDDALEGGGVLASLLWSLGTVEGLDANRLWTKVFSGDLGPVWMWVRSPSRRLKVAAEWGVARVEVDLDLGPNGFFMTVAQCVTQSPVTVRLSEPAWVDFGRGTLPATVPGASVQPAITIASRSSAEGPFAEMFFGDLANRFSRSRSRRVATLSRSAPRSLASFFDAFGRANGEPCRTSWDAGAEVVEDAADSPPFSRLRQARGLSLVELANRLTALTGRRVSKDTLRRFESGIGTPHDRLLPVAIDHLLGAEGRLVDVEIRADRGEGAVTLPPYWRGPVWFELGGPRADRTIQIQWGDWNREVTGRLPMQLAYHYSEPGVPLRIATGSDVRWRVGVGRRDDATVINQGWDPLSVDVAHQAISETEEALLVSLERGVDDDPRGRSRPDSARPTK